MKIGFDNEKYLKMQSEHIKERIAQFGGKLYLCLLYTSEIQRDLAVGGFWLKTLLEIDISQGYSQAVFAVQQTLQRSGHPLHRLSEGVGQFQGALLSRNTQGTAGGFCLGQLQGQPGLLRRTIHPVPQLNPVTAGFSPVSYTHLDVYKRQRRVLSIIADLYTKTGEPVGSKVVALYLDLSLIHI